MALQVWLPLNGNLDNNGISNPTVVNNGATVATTGKIGSCYSFDGSDDFISINDSNLYRIFTGGSQPFSIAFWVYHADSTRAIIFGDYGLSGAINFNVEFTTNHVVRFFWDGAPDKYFSSCPISTSVWAHITLTYDGTTLTCYKDGVLGETWTGPLSAKNKTSGVFYLGRDSRTGSTALNGRLNDFRIYDHALSPREVAEIAKGLVLHYPLSMPGQENNIKASTIHNRGCNGFSYSSATNTWTMTVPIGSNTWGYGIVINDASIKWKSGESWVVSMEVYVPKAISWNHDINNKPDVSDTSPYTGNDYDDQRLFCSNGVMSSHNLQAGWNKIWFTQRAPAAYGLFNYSTNFGIVTTNETSAIDIQIRNIKGEIIPASLEVKPSPWLPNPADAAYSALGFNDGIEYDTSGYGHNADIINSPTYTADTPRYQTAIHMTATNQKLHVSNLVTSGFGNTYSIAWWGKSNTYSGTMHWGFSDGIRLNGIYNGNLWNTGDGSNNPLYKPGTTTQVTAPTVNAWHHFVMVGDGSTCKAYMDGELWGQAKTYKAISGTSIYFNGWDSSTSYCQSDLNVSDFRIYATALTADQVKQLYEAPISLANNGMLFANEFNET